MLDTHMIGSEDQIAYAAVVLKGALALHEKLNSDYPGSREREIKGMNFIRALLDGKHADAARIMDESAPPVWVFLKLIVAKRHPDRGWVKGSLRDFENKESMVVVAENLLIALESDYLWACDLGLVPRRDADVGDPEPDQDACIR